LKGPAVWLEDPPQTACQCTKLWPKMGLTTKEKKTVTEQNPVFNLKVFAVPPLVGDGDMVGPSFDLE